MHWRILLNSKPPASARSNFFPRPPHSFYHPLARFLVPQPIIPPFDSQLSTLSVGAGVKGAGNHESPPYFPVLLLPGAGTPIPRLSSHRIFPFLQPQDPYLKAHISSKS